MLRLCNELWVDSVLKKGMKENCTKRNSRVNMQLPKVDLRKKVAYHKLRESAYVCVLGAYDDCLTVGLAHKIRQ